MFRGGWLFFRASIEDIIALRKLKKIKGGIDLEKLNAGEPKKKRKKKSVKVSSSNEESVIEDTLPHDETHIDDRLEEELSFAFLFFSL